MAMKADLRVGLALASLLAFCAGGVSAQEMFSGGFKQQTGEAIYRGVCQGCHMPDAKGAVGAGAYPALANNPNLASPVYPAVVIVNGQKAMPAFGGYFSDDQIAAVINYVRSNFGNHYADKITPDQVKSVRPAKAQSAEMF
jgi:mono/diheme cytochrome c family protein